jgi:hypothetical protein
MYVVLFMEPAMMDENRGGKIFPATLSQAGED